MSFFEFLETLIIGPLKLVFEIIFSMGYYVTDRPGISIIALSIAMNILVLPLYRQADAMQERARDTDARLRRGVEHIKKTFSGDERMMILQTYYRQNNYRPTDALNGSVSLLLEVPFFMAAYQFLAHARALEGVSFGPIPDLGAPDGLLVLAGISFNLLPILMTAINFISSALYLKGFPLKTKLQLYGMALFFLVFLYDSPAGLVFYWTLNNLFSLVKNIFYRLKNPKKALRNSLFVLGIALVLFAKFQPNPVNYWFQIIPAAFGLALMVPQLVFLAARLLPLPARRAQRSEPVPNRRAFLLAGALLTILTGALIPSAVIGSSPQEFVDMGYFYHPLWYVAFATTLAAGFFLVWMNVFYWLASPRWKVVFQRLLWILCGVMLVDYLFFGTNLGTLTARLQYIEGLRFTPRELIANLAAVLAVVLLLFLLAKKFSRVMVPALLTVLIAIGSMSMINVVQIKQSVDQVMSAGFDADIQLPLSKNGKNVVVLMLDRAMSSYVPYMFAEKPELQEKFDGFSYYANTIAPGGCTNICTPSLLGGYEYTPVEINKRSDESLMEKHNEALKVMPTLFADSGRTVTVCDPVYANYQEIPDLSLYDDDPRIQAYITKGMFFDKEQKIKLTQYNRQNFFVFSIMKCMPLITQKSISCNGTYYNSDALYSLVQFVSSKSEAVGTSSDFLDSYNVLKELPQLTTITENDAGTFLLMTNNTTHEPTLLQEPEYLPAEVVNNTAYDEANADRFTLNGRTLIMDDDNQLGHYQVNMATMLRLADWFDYMRENGVYDNTRIILVADHGFSVGHIQELVLDPAVQAMDLECYLPLLMVKDFDSHGFTTSEEFMTIADVPTLAMEGVIENPVNPFTGKVINNDEKYAHDQFVSLSRGWSVKHNNGNVFYPSLWASVNGSPWDPDNWTIYDEECVLDSYTALKAD